MTETEVPNLPEKEGKAPPRATRGPGSHLRTLRAEARFRNDTRNLHRRERANFSNFLWNMMRLDLGPRITLNQLVGPNMDVGLDAAKDKALDTSVEYYRGKSDDRLVEVLKFFNAYLMQLARRDRDPENQRYLLFKAIDFARMIVQFSPMSVNSEAESIVLAIYIALGTEDSARFGHYMRSEEKVYRIMQRLEMSPNDAQVRMDLADELVRQTCHFDALVHYRILLRILVRRGENVQRSRGYVISKIGEVFDEMSTLTLGKLGDGRKLKSFLDRYNRDFAESGHELPPLGKPNSSQMNRLQRGLINEAVRWHQQAAAFSQLDRRVRARSAARAGQCLMQLGRYRKALDVMGAQFPVWRGIPENETSLREKANYLKLLSSAAMQSKQRSEVAWIAKESNDVSTKLSKIEKDRRDRDQARAAMQA